MAKIKQIARKLDNGFYERVSLGATNISELINDSNYITAADLPVDAVVIPFAEQYYIRTNETTEAVGEEYCRALMECFDENDNLIRDIYISIPKDSENLLSLNSYQNEGTDSSGNNTKVLDFSILYDNDGVFFIVVQVTLITDANKENVVIMMEIKSQTGLQRKLTFDKVPTKGSHYNPVTSDGIKTYVDNAVPTKLSVLTNDSGFITNTVTNLTNYYTKSETYTQDEVKALIDAITTLNIEVVPELPTTNISATTIYLKGSETTGTNDYEEWIYANNDWELIGTTAIDLSNYATKKEIPTTTSALTNDSGFITETELDNKGYIVGISDNRKIIAAGPGGVKYSLDGGKIWNDATGVNGGYGICYGNNKFVIAGPLGINYSEDGINWNSAENINWMMYDVAYGNNTFVAIGQTYGEVIYSSDGINWTSTGVVLDYYDTYYSIIYANGKFVITSGSQNNNRSYYSTDGITWLIMGGLPESTYYDIAYGQNKYIVVGEDYPYSCIDGLNWNLSIDNTSGYSRSQMAITYGNDRFISVGNGGKSYYSLNGSTWVEMSGLDTSDNYNNILYSEGEFICIGTNSVYRSKDGETWTKETAEIAIDAEDLVYTGTITTAEYYTKTEINNMLGSVGGDISLSDPLAYEAIV